MPAFDPAAEYSWVRGFNYQPSFEATGYAIWRQLPNRMDLVRRELECGKQYFPSWNVVRLWLSPDAFWVDTDSFMRSFDGLMNICAELNLKVIPTLFNNWHSVPDFGGVAEEQMLYWARDLPRQSGGRAADVAYRPYVHRIVGGYRNDPRILMWDTCNEAVKHWETSPIIVEWLHYLYGLCKEAGATAPVTTGTISEISAVIASEPACDVLTIHPYEPFSPDSLIEQSLQLASAKRKSLLVTECCWGQLEDAARARIVQSELNRFKRHRLGFVCHLLHETLVADGHRPDWGIVSGAGDMSFIRRDGTLRVGHAAFNEF